MGKKYTHNNHRKIKYSEQSILGYMHKKALYKIIIYEREREKIYFNFKKNLSLSIQDNILSIPKIKRSTFIFCSFTSQSANQYSYFLFPSLSVGSQDLIKFHLLFLTQRPPHSAITRSGWRQLLQFCQRNTDRPSTWNPDLINALSSGSYKFPNDGRRV